VSQKWQYSTFTAEPGATTQVFGINDKGQLSGFYNVPQQGNPRGNEEGFLTGRNGATISIPNFARATIGEGINDTGQQLVVGSFFGPPTDSTELFQNGKLVSQVTVPGEDTVTATGINNHGDIVGIGFGPISNPTGNSAPIGVQGFELSHGKTTIIAVPGANSGETDPAGIADNGTIVGSFTDASGGHHGFVDTNGHFKQLDVPGATETQVLAISPNAQNIAGDWLDSSNHWHGFLDTNGRVTTFDLPGSVNTEITGVNNAQEIIGNAWNAVGANQLAFTATTTGHGNSGPDLVTHSSGSAILTPLNVHTVVGPLHGTS
jgi:hypothetical protein